MISVSPGFVPTLKLASGQIKLVLPEVGVTWSSWNLAPQAVWIQAARWLPELLCGLSFWFLSFCFPSCTLRVSLIGWPEIHIQLQPLPFFKVLLRSKVQENLRRSFRDTLVFVQGFPGGSDGKESACNAEDLGSIPVWGKSPGEENERPLQYYCLENSMDRGAWWAHVHGVAKSRTRLSDCYFTFMASLVAQTVKNQPAMQKTQVQFLGFEDPLEKGMDSYSSIIAWRIPWTEEPGWLQSMGSQSIGYYLATFYSLQPCIYKMWG